MPVSQDSRRDLHGPTFCLVIGDVGQNGARVTRIPDEPPKCYPVLDSSMMFLLGRGKMTILIVECKSFTLRSAVLTEMRTP